MNTTMQRKRIWANKKLAILRRYKTSCGCMDCGYKDHFYALELDHRDDAQKVGNVCHLIKRTHSWAKIKEEIRKCDVVCANCHRIRTYNRKQFNGNPSGL